MQHHNASNYMSYIIPNYLSSPCILPPEASSCLFLVVSAEAQGQSKFQLSACINLVQSHWTKQIT